MSTTFWFYLYACFISVLAVYLPEHNCHSYFTYETMEWEKTYIGVFTAHKSLLTSFYWEAEFSARGSIVCTLRTEECSFLKVCWHFFAGSSRLSQSVSGQSRVLYKYQKGKSRPSKTLPASCPSWSVLSLMERHCAATKNVRRKVINFKNISLSILDLFADPPLSITTRVARRMAVDEIPIALTFRKRFWMDQSVFHSVRSAITPVQFNYYY